MTRSTLQAWFLPAALMAALAGCDADHGGKTNTAGMAESTISETTPTAVAELEPTAGHSARGQVVFRTVDDGVRITASLEGLEEGSHGFHIHETGDCSADDATSAGGHYAPQGSPHGAPGNPAQERHVGDLGNIEADAQGKAHYERVDSLLSLTGDHSILGRAVIVHRGADDLTSQPSGAAGARVACGVIEPQNGP